MILQAFEYVRSKKISVLITLFIFAVFFVFSSISSVYGNMISDTFEALTQEYGSFHAVIFDVSDEIVSRYHDSSMVEMTGIIENYGLRDCNDMQIVLGTMDKEAMELVSAAVIEGRLPEKPTEIVFEDCFKLNSDTIKVGNRVILTDKNDMEKEYEIVGFVSSYSSLINGSIYPIPDKNGYPNAITFPDSSIDTNKILLVKVSGSSDRTVSPDSSLISLYNEFVVSGTDQHNKEMVFNDQLFTDGVKMFIDPLKQHSRRDFTMSLIVISVFLTTVFHFYFYDLRGIALNLYRIGANRGRVISLFFIIVLIMLIPGIMTGELISATVCVLNRRALNDIRQEWLFIITFMVIACAALVFVLNRLYDENLFFTRQKKRKRINRGDSLEWNSIKRNSVGFVAVLLAVSMFFSSFISLDYESRANRSFYGLDSDSWIIGDAYNTITFHNFGDFQVFPVQKGFSNKALDDLYEMKGIKGIRKGYEHAGVNIIFPDIDNEYIDEYVKRNIQFGYGDFVTDSYIHKIKSSNNYSVVVIEDHMDKEVLLINEISEEPLNEGKCYVFFPDLSGDKCIKNDMDKLYHPGGYIRLASLLMKDGETDIYQIDSFDYVYTDIEIADVFTHGFNMADGETGDYISSDSLTIVLSEKTFIESEIFKGISHFKIDIEKDITGEEYEKIKLESLKLTQSVPGAQFYDSEERRSRIDRIEKASASSLKVLGAYAFICIVFYTVMMTLQSVQINRHAYGILRSVGMTRKRMFGYLINEYLIYFILMLSIVSVAVLIYLRQYSVNVVGIILRGKDYIRAFLPILLYCIGYMISQIICGLLMINRYFRTSIVSNIRYKE